MTDTDAPLARACTYCDAPLSLLDEYDGRRAFACHLEATPACLARAVTDLTAKTPLTRGQARARILADAVGERVHADAVKSLERADVTNRAARRAAAHARR